MDKSVVDESKIRCNVKKERFDDEIKEFAETTMNEMLGWYGYDTNRRDIKNVGQFNTHHTHSNSTSSGSDSPKFNNTDGCGWCGKQVEENTGLTSNSSTFCSELCFSQSRRANFKKNKTCDWCRHVRHTVSYVDFQDGASQLQFCSDKCLNQYKMQIFCRETRAHLEMHPHLNSGNVEESDNALIITPDLWMKNCKSPDSKSSTPPQSPLSSIDIVQQTSPLPLITLTHPSKLLAKSTENDENVRTKRSKMQKKRKRSSTITTTNHNNNNNCNKMIDVPQDLRIRHSPINVCDTEDTRTKFERTFIRSAESICENSNNNNNNNNDNQRQTSQNHSNILPPVTVLVPYPILLPVPLPIPIPLPITSFLRAEKTRNKETSSLNHKNSSHTDMIVVERDDDDDDEKIIERQEMTDNDVISTPVRKRKRVVDSKSKIHKNTDFLTTTTL